MVILDDVSMGGLDNTQCATAKVPSGCSQSNINHPQLKSNAEQQTPSISQLEVTSPGIKTRAANHLCECHH